LAGDQRVIGFYRTQLEQRIQLRGEDIECARTKFDDPTNVFLVIRPHDGRVSAAFFFWHEGSVVGGLTFPFSISELKSPSWQTLVGGSSKRGLSSLVARVQNRVLRVSTRPRIGLFVLVATVIALGGVLHIYHLTADSPHTLGLRVERALLGIIVGWNPATPEIADAKDANLLIMDGSSPPAVLRLTASELHAGRVFYPSVGDRVEVRLDIIGTIGKATTESVVSVSRAADLGSSVLATTIPNTGVATQQAGGTPAQKVSEDSSTGEPPEMRARAPASIQLSPITKATVNDWRTILPREASDVQSVRAGRKVAEGPRTSFRAAVPMYKMRPEIESQLTPLIQIDNVVEVQVSIDAFGKVTAAQLASTKGPVADLLSKSALNAALGWKFRPATRDGEAVASEMVLEFVFPSSSR
jgi:hypothetical protein